MFSIPRNRVSRGRRSLVRQPGVDHREPEDQRVADRDGEADEADPGPEPGQGRPGFEAFPRWLGRVRQVFGLV